MPNLPAAQILDLILVGLSAIPQLVQEAEAAFGGRAGTGPQKKAFVLDLFRHGITIAAGADPKVAKFLTPDIATRITAAAGEATDSAVSVLNATVWKEPAVNTVGPSPMPMPSVQAGSGAPPA